MSIEGFSETVLGCTQAGRLINGPDCANSTKNSERLKSYQKLFDKIMQLVLN
jgi:hypothetical protein